MIFISILKHYNFSIVYCNKMSTEIWEKKSKTNNFAECTINALSLKLSILYDFYLINVFSVYGFISIGYIFVVSLCIISYL